MTLTEILSRLEGVKGSGGQYSAKCPNHGDQHNSLSVSVGKDGRVLLNCHAGCAPEDIVWAMGLQMKDLFAEVKPGDVFPSYGTPKRTERPPVVATYTYPSGVQKLRRADKSFTWRQPDKCHGWVWNRKGIPHELYVAGELTGAVFVCEGEKDADTLHTLGYDAASGEDGAGPGKWRKEYTEQLKGLHVCVFQDNDQVGKDYAAETCNALHGVAASVRLLDLSTVWPEIPEHGDVTDMVEALGAETAVKQIAALIANTSEWAPTAAPVEDGKPLLMPMTDVEARQASYLISPYLPRGMLAIMGGVSGAGKTYLILSWAAAVSNGQRLPFQSWTSPAPPSGYVYYFTQENDPNTVIRPRLDLLGADLSKILIQATSGATYEPLTLNDPRLEEAAKQYPPTMIIFDPIQSYLGAGVDMNKAERVRPVLDWLGDYAKRHNCTVVLVSHMSKPGVGNTLALDRLLGSSDFRNAARSIIVVGRDPKDKESRVFAHGKNSIGEPGESQRYHIDGKQGVVYDGVCDLSADDIVKQSEDGRGRNKPAVTLTSAIKQLEELLWAGGYATMEQVDTLQAAAGISHGTMVSARKELGLKKVSIGQPPNRKNWWLMPDVDIDKFKLEHTPAPEQTAIPI